MLNAGKQHRSNGEDTKVGDKGTGDRKSAFRLLGEQLQGSKQFDVQ